jgi:puromycin-sensitive aminopeptidase
VARVTERPSYRLPRNALPKHYALVFEPDFDRAGFDGEATIDLDVLEVTSELVLNAADLEISEASLVRNEGAGSPEEVSAEVSLHPEEEQVTVRATAPLGPGPWQLRLHFSGKLNDLLRGFYRSRFRDEHGRETWVAVTQFEATDARRAFPCWDEPDLKATFGITVVADGALTVLSNAGEAASEDLGNGKRRTRFADTMKMSTYLVAVLIGPFELTAPRDVDGVPLRIGHVPGRAALTGLAEDAAAHALRFLRDYFSMPYPADKLDHVGVPDFAAGAMENVGLVTYRETALLVGAQSAQVERQRVVSTISHETAHMWFGDLVTMRWWEGIWLNEAFATFMELLVADAFEPRWQIWTSFGVDRAAALATDGLRSSRAIEYPVGRPEEAEDMFDVITYDKGGCVLRMIERYLGDEVFRKGLNLYLRRHQFSNTSTTDLWDALEEASGQPVRAAMGTWVNQAGHPVVSASLTGPSELQLSQQRFLLDGSSEEAQRWAVPVTLRYATHGGNIEHYQFLLQDSSTTVALKGEPTWVLVNEGAWGVYRSRYSDDLRRHLFGAIGQLDDRERLGLVSDTWAGTVAGHVPLETSTELLSLLHDERDPDVWWAASGGLGLLELVCTEDDLPTLRELVRNLAAGVFDRVGAWGQDGRADEPVTPREARLRARLVTLLGTLGASPEVRSEARRRLADADAGRSPLAPDLATAVAQVVAAGGGSNEWELLHSHYKRATTPQDEVRYLHALGGFSDPDLVRRSLELAFSGEIRSQDAPYLLMGILGHREGCALAWEAIEQHWDEMPTAWPPNTIHRMLEALPTLVAAGEGTAARAEAWLAAHPLARGERKVVQSRERLAINLAFKRRVAPQLTTVLTKALARSGGPSDG